MIAALPLSEEERINWLRLARTENIGAVTFHALLARFGSASAAIEALPDLSKRGGIRRNLSIYARNLAEDELATAQKLGAHVVAPGERGYPPFLCHVHGAPPLLYVSRNLDVAAMDCVGVVGARNASALGLKFARLISRSLADQGMLVTSGLARGIDTAAHEAALQHATAAVLAGGIDHVYPPENAKLHAEIAERGLLITEMPPGTAPKPEYFPRRNRIISGMSRAVIVVEAALRSGSLITARYAAEQGREVFAVPGSPLDPRAEGTNRLIKEGAQILTSVSDVFESLKMTALPQADIFLETEPRDYPANVSDGDRELLLSLLSRAETAVDDLIRESRLPAELIAAILMELEVAGRVSRSSGGHIALV